MRRNGGHLFLLLEGKGDGKDARATAKIPPPATEKTKRFILFPLIPLFFLLHFPLSRVGSPLAQGVLTLKKAFRSPNGAAQPEPRATPWVSNSSLVKALKGRSKDSDQVRSPFQGFCLLFP